MVSKIKRIPTKSTKSHGCSRHTRRRSPIKHVVAISSAVLYSIHRRLTKLFSKLKQLGTPNRRKGYQLLKTTPHLEEKEEEQQQEQRFHEESLDSIRRTLFFSDPSLLPPMLSPHRRTVFLDLDETLVHSKADPPPDRFDFIVQPRIDGHVVNFYVLKRPGVDKFLEFLAPKYEVVVFTAAMEEYAALVLDRVDPKRLISHRLYRDSCRQVDGKLVKDLSEAGRDLKRVVIVDDNPNSYAKQPENAVPIRPFIDDIGDRELWKLIKFFEISDSCDDMRDAVKRYVR